MDGVHGLVLELNLRSVCSAPARLVFFILFFNYVFIHREEVSREPTLVF
jgi:hypothetical protein